MRHDNMHSCDVTVTVVRATQLQDLVFLSSLAVGLPKGLDLHSTLTCVCSFAWSSSSHINYAKYSSKSPSAGHVDKQPLIVTLYLQIFVYTVTACVLIYYRVPGLSYYIIVSLYYCRH